MIVVTDEDPRGEDRVAILEEIGRAAEIGGATRGDRLHLIPDRTEAIGFAIERARPGDTVLLAGKGHERTIETARENGALGRARERRGGGAPAAGLRGRSRMSR